MKSHTREKYRLRAEIIKALAHPTRLYIVDMLSRERRFVGELAEMIGCDISTVSRHLLVLKNAGIVEDNKQGLRIWYRLRVPCVLKFFSCVENVLKANSRQLKNSINE